MIRERAWHVKTDDGRNFFITDREVRELAEGEVDKIDGDGRLNQPPESRFNVADYGPGADLESQLLAAAAEEAALLKGRQNASDENQNETV